jgi:hypothetical protein
MKKLMRKLIEELTKKSINLVESVRVKLSKPKIEGLCLSFHHSF